jgi:endonuclease-3
MPSRRPAAAPRGARSDSVPSSRTAARDARSLPPSGLAARSARSVPRATRRRRALATDEIGTVMAILRRAAPSWGAPAVTLIAETTGDPFRVLISTILSLRTQDATTAVAARRLFARAATPQAMLRLRAATIAKLIYPVGFYRTKARTILAVCRALLERFGGEVPRDLDALLTFQGVGRKTANLVLTLGFGAPGICVDTHVHRITNRWGYVRTRVPNDTEQALRRKLPRAHWIEINDLLVAFGQRVCRPISPHCTRCPIAEHCPRRGVTLWR